MFCATLYNGNFVAFNNVLRKEVRYLNVPGFNSAIILPVFLHIYCTLIILEQNVPLNVISLCSNE